MSRGAGPKPCAQCPWRLANQGCDHPEFGPDAYGKRNLGRLWAGLRDGKRMSCHPSVEPSLVRARLTGLSRRRECAGALILVQRELARYEHCAAEAEAAGR